METNHPTEASNRQRKYPMKKCVIHDRISIPTMHINVIEMSRENERNEVVQEAEIVEIVETVNEVEAGTDMTAVGATIVETLTRHEKCKRSWSEIVCFGSVKIPVLPT